MSRAVSKRDWRVHPPYLFEAYTSTVRRSLRRRRMPKRPSLRKT
jgi:hypothetical protein